MMKRMLYHVAALLIAALTGLGAPAPAPAAQAGIDWQTVGYGFDQTWMSITYGNGVFVAVAQDGTGKRVMTSPDGISWTARQTPAADIIWESVTYGNGLFVAVGMGGSSADGLVMTSPDGITWTPRTAASNNQWWSVTYGNGLFVAVATSGAGNRVMTSPDGITWTSRTSAADNYWMSVTYGNGLFVAVASTGVVGNQVMTSPDGITWTSRTAAGNYAWWSVTYGNGLFVAVSYSSGSNNWVMTSPDGISWTLRTPAVSTSWSYVTYGNGLFVAVGGSGTGNGVMTSPDGITWTIRTSAANHGWNSVAYGDGLFVAVASSGTGDRIMTSPDGITWTSRTYNPDLNWRSATYGNGLFVAVAISGTGNRVMTSPDGTTWTARTSAADYNWYSVTYGNGLFVAVAQSGYGDRVMISGSPAKSDQTITVDQAAPANAAYGSTFDVKAHASSGLDVAVSTSGACSGGGSSSGNPGSAVTITMTGGTGTCTVKYDQAGNSSYNAAQQVTNSTTASKADQSITVTTAAPPIAVYGTQFTVAAHATSALDVTYSSGSPTVCTNAGADFTMVSGTGTCAVQYDQAGNGNFNPAPQVVENTTAQKAASTVSVDSSINPSSVGQSVTFTATVTPVGLTGTVDFKDNGGSITGCSAVSISSNQATCTTSALTAGSHSITAVSSGNNNYNGSTSSALTQTVNSAGLNITTASLPDAYLTKVYNRTLAVSGGTGPYTWSITSRTKLPKGLSLNATTGVISGTPTIVVTNSSITFQVKDSLNATAAKTIPITVLAPPDVATTVLASGTVGVPYSQPLVGKGGKPPYTWSLVNGSSLPPGLELSSAGVISGTPTVAGRTSFYLKITDANGVTSKNYGPLGIRIYAP